MPPPRSRAELGATRLLVSDSTASARSVSALTDWFRLFYEADRRPRLAALPENRPRRNHGAPVCVGVILAGRGLRLRAASHDALPEAVDDLLILRDAPRVGHLAVGAELEHLRLLPEAVDAPLILGVAPGFGPLAVGAELELPRLPPRRRFSLVRGVALDVDDPHLLAREDLLHPLPHRPRLREPPLDVEELVAAA